MYLGCVCVCFSLCVEFGVCACAYLFHVVCACACVEVLYAVCACVDVLNVVCVCALVFMCYVCLCVLVCMCWMCPCVYVLYVRVGVRACLVCVCAGVCGVCLPYMCRLVCVSQWRSTDQPSTLLSISYEYLCLCVAVHRGGVRPGPQGPACRTSEST